MAQLPKHSVQIFFGKLLAENGHHTRQTRSYGEHPKNLIDIYEPSTTRESTNKNDRGPVIFFLYGGGWREGTREIYEFIGAAMAKQGWTTVIPDYRVFPEVKFPGFIEDAARAYAWTSKNIANGRPIIIMGHSAGAHSGAMIALNSAYLSRLDEKISPPTALIGISGPYSFDPTTWPSTKDIFASAPSADAARPAAHVSESAPPAFLIHGLKDTTVRLYNLETLAENYRKAGRRVETKTYSNLAHIDILLTIARPLRWRAPVFEDIKSFIRNQSRDAQAIDSVDKPG